MTEKRRALTIEVLERLAEAMLEYTSNGQRFNTKMGTIAYEDHDKVVDALKAYRAATAPLRTRASVDAEIVALVRERRTPGSYDFSSMHLDQLRALCSEPTADEPAQNPEALPWDAEDQALADACSCDESERLKRKLDLVRAHAQQGITSSKYPSCKAEAACREILLLTSP